MTVKKISASAPAPGAPFFTPAQEPPAGTALVSPDRQDVPTLFTPLTLRGLTLQNRFVVSPMCTYSADDGHLTDWHLVHLGAYALRGAALTIVEATAVAPNGRISPEDSGLWQDSQIAPLKRVVDFVHSQGQKIGIQLAHAGRKASTVAPWHVTERGRHEVAGPDVGGWPESLVAPTAVAWDDGFPTPNELTAEQIEAVVRGFADAARRAVEAGVDTVEIHGAHGYLISEFLSPITNQRQDRYGGSFANRTRLLTEVVQAVRAVIPAAMPLLVRISATEWMEHAHASAPSSSSSPSASLDAAESWTIPQSKQLALALADLGVDLLDVSSGGNNPRQQVDPKRQVDIAGEIRAELLRHGKTSLKIGAVGLVYTAERARDVVQLDEGGQAKADLVFVGRQFLREPEFVLTTAAKLGVKVQPPIQYHRAPYRL
ncbi:hypothetical protein VTJ83DRAFT_2364 [Remersonia thermophila]|uniref:NADH:flavin oxidoreductase/NADH oxidase N-terminal domain-containing protein n=1 Tax=Remersonia thermophila TaxID=72144 RepID=A0ABR4DJ50_9PEZI